ncbi:deoxyribonuclease, TatD family protein [Gracilibacillus halophilus YIM-C55.5]|uniref:Deoxyribonuclease, TatD family protein n=1 Tax=Gracilibacillus halophilus YIM-C55.5 TaxID=1308866 RepID=N4WD79_9BACI|nr:TatD family hydrolase [Gracilibacillus halophilus]ENH97229.1 deoxyribonuclease, TatD family protein [Gracilibacillus halophilus YIM-C55.5]
MIDAHIHLDWYQPDEQDLLLQEFEQYDIRKVIAVASDLDSCQRVWQLHQQDQRVFPAFGWHPEQSLPSRKEMDRIIEWIDTYQSEIVAVGEVGLPYYKRKKEPRIDLPSYIDLFERFVQVAKRCNLPIVLHAIYEDADVVCDLLEKYQIEKAHFHWFKGDMKTVERIQQNGYMISVTPDCVYEAEIQKLIDHYPVSQLMVETDGPWPFKGPFQGEMTHPKMMSQSIHTIANIKKMTVDEVDKQLEENTNQFFRF